MNLDELKDNFEYDNLTGIVTRKVDGFGRWKKGQVCGSYTGQGYIEIKFKGKSIGLHRIAWALFYNEQPPQFIDHINRIPNDNRIENLRAATKSQNGANRVALKNNTCGVKGCYYVPSQSKNGGIGKWRVQCRVNGKLHNLGKYLNIDDARDAYNKFAVIAFGDYHSAA